QLHVFQMLGCTDLGEELDRALNIFPSYLQSQYLGMHSLVLRGVLRLTRRPDTARRTLVLLPYIMEQLQRANSETSVAVLPVLSDMLRLLEGKMRSVVALAAADKLQRLFDNESSAVWELAICLFQGMMGFVARSEKKKMKQEVCRSLLPLLFHMHDE
ncbi:hypothetical protein N338_06296, partial [Podiceps cristatus]